MKYTPDHKYEKSIKLIKYLTKNEPLPRSYDRISEEEILELLLYHIEKQNEHNDILRKRINEYQSVFNAIGKFIPSKGATVYG